MIPLDTDALARWRMEIDNGVEFLVAFSLLFFVPPHEVFDVLICFILPGSVDGDADEHADKQKNDLCVRNQIGET